MGGDIKLFRYFNEEYGLQALSDLEMKCSEPLNLNDPFEFSPKLKHFEPTFERAKPTIMHVYPFEKYRPTILYPTKALIRQSYEVFLRKIFEDLKPDFHNNLDDLEESFADYFDKHWLLLCFSEINKSTLMWSHYSEMHRGIVIEFSTKDPVFKDLMDLKDLKAVNYRKNRKDYISVRSDDPKFEKELMHVAYTKASYWEYEKELRLVLPKREYASMGLYNKNISIDSQDIKKFFFKFNKSAIKNIFLGYRFTELEKILNIINELQINCGIYKAWLNKRKFTISFRKLPFVG